MSINLFLKSLKEIRISWPSYALGMVAYVWMLLSVYPTVQSADIQRLIRTYPKEFLEFFGGGTGANLATVEGFLALEIFAFMWFVIIGAFVIAYGTGAIGKEIDTGTIEILLSQPVSRTSALITKSITLFGGTAGLVILTMASVYLFGNIYNVSVRTEGIIALAIIAILFFAAIGAFSLFFSVILERGRAAMASAGILTAMYLLTVLAGLADWAEKLDVISLFHYYDSAKLLTTGDIPLRSVLVYFGTATSFYISAILLFNRRDIAV
ncbi:MAG: ABC transporter permease [Firmicutes bacterium]|nr:ABC transporter permease [Bacillota bacterium]